MKNKCSELVMDVIAFYDKVLTDEMLVHFAQNLPEKDVEIVMKNCEVSRTRAIRSLVVCKGNIVDAIMYMYKIGIA